MPRSATTPLPTAIRWLPVWMLVLGLALTVHLHRDAQQDARDLQQAAFEVRTAEVAAALTRRLHANAALLRGVAGLFVSSDEVNAEEFHRYINGVELTTAYPGILGVGFSLWQPPGTTPREGDAQSRIVYLEPMDWRNRRAIGYDMFGEPVRRAAMERAAETGAASLSGRVTLVQETEQDVQSGFLMYVPIYAAKPPLTDTAARWRALRGWAYSPVRAGDMIESLLQRDLPKWQDRIGLALYAGLDAQDDALLYRRALAQPADDLLRQELPITFNGTSWLLRIEGTRQMTQVPDGGYTTATAGTLISLLVALTLGVVMRSHQQARLALAERIQAHQQLEQQQAELRLAGTVMASSPLGIVVTSRTGELLSVNPAFTRITGYEPAEALGQSARMLEATHAPEGATEPLWDQLQAEGRWEGELQYRRKNGEAYPAFLSFTQVRDGDGRLTHYVGLLQDITERRSAEDRIRQLAHHDYLTGLPNRALLVERATLELAAAQRYHRHPALLFMDLDRFKPVNDTYGHEAGDAVLKEVARRLLQLLRQSDLVCRQGGDEFVILLPDHHSREGLLRLARKLVATVEEPYPVAGASVTLSGSIGIAVYPDHGTTVDELIRSADEAMYLAKHKPEEHICVAPLKDATA